MQDDLKQLMSHRKNTNPEERKYPHVLIRGDNRLLLVGPFDNKVDALEWAEENETINEEAIDNWNITNIELNKNAEDILLFVTSC